MVWVLIDVRMYQRPIKERNGARVASIDRRRYEIDPTPVGSVALFGKVVEPVCWVAKKLTSRKEVRS